MATKNPASVFRMKIFRVTHKRGDVETVYLVYEVDSHHARLAVMKEVGGDVGGDLWNAMEFTPSEPYKLYSINRLTGETL